MTHVPYRNIAQYGPDLIAGTGAARLPVVPERRRPDRRKGAIPLAVAGDKRIPALPDTPTTTEAGMPEYKDQRLVRAARAGGTPKPILERLNKEVKAALKDPAGEEGLRKARAPRRCGCRSTK